MLGCLLANKGQCYQEGTVWQPPSSPSNQENHHLSVYHSMIMNHDKSWSSVVKVKKLLWTELFNGLLRYSVCWPHLLFAFALPLGHVIRIPNLSSTASMRSDAWDCHVWMLPRPYIQPSNHPTTSNYKSEKQHKYLSLLKKMSLPEKHSLKLTAYFQVPTAFYIVSGRNFSTCYPPRYIFTFVAWSHQVGSFTNQSFDGT